MTRRIALISEHGGGETEWRLAPLRMPDFVARDLADAAAIVLGEPSGTAALPVGATG